MNDSILRRKVASYNLVQDLLSQIEITLMNEFVSSRFLDKIYELRCMIEHETRIVQDDINKYEKPFLS
jgi:hypothetical protein